MVFKLLFFPCVWTKVTSALKGLRTKQYGKVLVPMKWYDILMVLLMVLY